MKKLDSNDYYLCRLQGKVFEKSLTYCDTSSPIFIRRFMNSKIAKAFDNKTILLSSLYVEGVLQSVIDEYGQSAYGKIKYDDNVMFWIGYFYRVLSIYFNMSSKAIYKMFKLEEIKDFYYIGHTFDPEVAAQKIMESKNNDIDYTKKGVEILKQLIKEENKNHSFE